MPRVLLRLFFHPCNHMSLFSENLDLLDTSRYESEDEDQLNRDRMAKIKEAEAQENVRLKTINLRARMAKRVGSPLGTSNKAQSGSKVGVPVEPAPKKNKTQVKKPAIRPVISPPDEDLGGNSYLFNSSMEDDDNHNQATIPPVVDKNAGADVLQPFRIPRRERTSAILPEKFWPADMTASQIDKFTIDQVLAMVKFF